MKRRVFLVSALGVTSISGCSLGGGGKETIKAEGTISVVGDGCTDEDNSARVTKTDENTVQIDGTITSVDSSESLQVTTYASPKESEIIMRVYTVDTETPTRGCSGSLSYEATVTYTNIEPSSARVLHESDQSVIVTEATL